jgi:hypothetical protein
MRRPAPAEGGLVARVLDVRDLLGGASPAHQPGSIKMIRKFEAQIAALDAQIPA